MLLGWVSQMTAILDKPESPAIQDVLLTMAQQYPMVSFNFDDTVSPCGTGVPMNVW